MSHFTTVGTLLTELDPIANGLRDLGYNPQIGTNLAVKGYAGTTATAEIVVSACDGYDIGFVRKEQGYEMVADWSMIASYAGTYEQPYAEKFVADLTQRYALHVALDQMALQGFEIDGQIVTEQDGTIRLAMNQYSLG